MKLYDQRQERQVRYNPPECVGTRESRIEGRPDPAHVRMSHVECQNLTTLMSMRRFTRPTAAFSKETENHAHTVAPYATWYNFARIYETLKVTPAMAAGVSARLWDMADVAALVDARETIPAKRGSYKPGAAESVEVSN